MPKYLLIYHGEAMGQTKEDQDKQMAAWGAWMQQCGENLVDAGNPTSTATSVTKDSSAEYSGSERVSGYSIINAPDMESAQKAASMTPIVVDGSGSVDVYETLEVM